MTAPQRHGHEVLGVARDAHAKTTEDAHHRLAVMRHPRRNRPPGKGAGAAQG